MPSSPGLCFLSRSGVCPSAWRPIKPCCRAAVLFRNARSVQMLSVKSLKSLSRRFPAEPHARPLLHGRFAFLAPSSPHTPRAPLAEQRPGRCLSSLPGLSLPEKAAGLPILWFWPHSEAGPDSTWAANKCQHWRRRAYMSSGQLQVCTGDPFSSTLVRAARCRRRLPSTRSPSWCS